MMKIPNWVWVLLYATCVVVIVFDLILWRP
jgi:hypothetical protein